MTSTLRILLVAAVTLSTVLVGVRDTLAALRTTEGRTCAVEGESAYGSRANDSGIKSEQVEEDDADEEEGRDVHFLGIVAGVCHPDPLVRAVLRSPICRAANLLCRAALVRGPPAWA